MTTAHEVDLPARSGEMLIAGIAWPTYKLIALVVGFVLALILGVTTMNPAATVLGAAGVTTVVWLGLSVFQPAR